uniref:Transposon protein, putative, unclassified n=1 Tax=Oryza sativa subsp. japonica TaxID=39947 RepID=Q7XDY0_ORYSJ|nr:transposon protein, putative, unclassified [Oryza sativa Japonica Group]
MATVSAANSASNISASINSIPVLTGANFKEWKENVLIVLGVMDLDLALRKEQPILSDKSTKDENMEHERWDRSNRMSLMIMKRSIPEAFRDSTSEEVTTAKVFLETLQKRFARNEKAETSTLLAKLISMRYKGKGNMREYIMEMSHLASKLKALKLDLSEDLLMHLILISLPTQFNQFKVSYNCQKDKWTVNKLISHCVQEEERLKQDRIESAHLSMTSNNKKRKSKEAVDVQPPLKKRENNCGEEPCYFCKKEGHMKKNCTKYHAWRAKKGETDEYKEIKCPKSYRCLRTDSYRYLWAIPYGFLEWSTIFYHVHRRFLKIWQLTTMATVSGDGWWKKQLEAGLGMGARRLTMEMFGGSTRPRLFSGWEWRRRLVAEAGLGMRAAAGARLAAGAVAGGGGQGGEAVIRTFSILIIRE